MCPLRYVSEVFLHGFGTGKVEFSGAVDLPHGIVEHIKHFGSHVDQIGNDGERGHLGSLQHFHGPSRVHEGG